ncbi:MAG: SPOR domain-containing protein, partial [Bacteroidetes bacterium]|nr:SPOR domain-containing protein [Bacteroidota bacterium]
IDQLKVDNARTKIAGTMNRPTDNTLVISQLKARSDSNQVQIDQLKAELAKAKESETALENSRRSKDSLLRHFLISETDALLTQLKAKSDTNQVQFERLKVELENTKNAKQTPESNKENEAVIAQLKVKSDAYQTQIDQLKEELVIAKDAERAGKSNDSLVLVNSQSADVKLALLKAKSESNQAQIDQLKVDNARTKIAGTLTSPATDNSIVIGQLKVKSDSSQAQIDRLKTELARVKNIESKAPPTAEYGELIEQLKTQSENNQAQIDMLVETITKAKEEKPKTTDSNKPVADNKEVSRVLLAEQSNSNVEIEKLDPELEKIKDKEASKLVPILSASRAPSSISNGFVDEKGELASNGFYIVIGAFGSKENAEKFKAATILKGHKNTKIIQNKNTKMYNICALKTNNKRDADLERAKYKGEYSNVWILNLD